MTAARRPEHPAAWWRRVRPGDIFATVVSLFTLAAVEIVQLIVLWAIAAIRIPYDDRVDLPQVIARRQLTLALALLGALNGFEVFVVWRAWRRRRRLNRPGG
ncbi:MAG TPA: hypothetical protein VGN54_04195 [Mycobacteriales bacterium]|jgi:hypothetical protein|nr:hypothetical protein [Mycobacteriales bacterium]